MQRTSSGHALGRDIPFGVSRSERSLRLRGTSTFPFIQARALGGFAGELPSAENCETLAVGLAQSLEFCEESVTREWQ
jgi:hypothetical protein